MASCASWLRVATSRLSVSSDNAGVMVRHAAAMPRFGPVCVQRAVADRLFRGALAVLSLQHKRDLGRFVKWPRYVRVQRQRKILQTRLKVPPALNQFKAALDRNQAAEVFKLLAKYSPETKAEKRDRIAAAAGAAVKTGEAPAVLKFGLNHVTQLIESKKAKFVAIANDVDPVEVRSLWVPQLCVQMCVWCRCTSLSPLRTCACVGVWFVVVAGV